MFTKHNFSSGVRCLVPVLCIVAAALLPTEACAQLGSEPDSKALTKAFKESRKQPPGFLRLQALGELARHPFVSNLELFLGALGENARDTALLYKALDKQMKRWDGLDKRRLQLRDKNDQGVKLENVVEEQLTLRGDMEVQRLQIGEYARENTMLRKGWLNAWSALAEADKPREIDKVIRLAKRDKKWPLRRECASLLSEAGRAPGIAFIVQMLSKDKNPSVRALAAKALATVESKASAQALASALADPFDVVRLAVLKSLRKVGDGTAIPILIERISLEKGHLKEQVVLTLRSIAGVNYFDNVSLWQGWWEKEAPGFVPARKDKRRRYKSKSKAAKAGKGFYGLRTTSEALVFLIDTSGSMNEPAPVDGVTGAGRMKATKLDRAKRELIRTLQGLPSGVSINVCAYGTELEPYANKMVTLNDANRRGLKAWVNELRATGQTNIFGALDWALRLASGHVRRGITKAVKKMPIDSIYLLSDGRPTAGAIVEGSLLAREVERMNRSLGITIHCIGVGRDHDKILMRALSESSGGLYINAR